MIIYPKLPFNFEFTCAVFNKGDPQIEIYENGEYKKVLRLNKGLFLVKVKDGVDKLMINSEDKEVVDKVKFIFDTDRDTKEFYDSVKNDEVLSDIARQLKGMRIPSTASVFEAMVYAIIEQQIALKVAWVMQKRLIKKFGEVIEDHYAFPTAERLANASINELRECGLSQRKAEYIKGIAEEIIKGFDIEGLKDKPNEEVIEELMKLRGVGMWTAEYCMARGMHKLDAIPADDLGLRKAIGRLYFKKDIASGEECRKIAEKWKGWRGYASFYILREKGLLRQV